MQTYRENPESEENQKATRENKAEVKRLQSKPAHAEDLAARIANELRRSSNEWLNTREDPNNVAYAVAIALESAARAIIKVVEQESGE